MIDRYDSSARPDDLIFRLRRLPRAVSPEHDLWPQIALRIGATGLEHGSGSRRSRRWRTRGLLALAASALLATVLVGSLDRAPSGSAGRAPAPQLVIEDPLGLRATADAMRLEYTLAAGQLAGLPVPAELREGIAELDRSAEQLEAALETDPGVVASNFWSGYAQTLDAEVTMDSLSIEEGDTVTEGDRTYAIVRVSDPSGNERRFYLRRDEGWTVDLMATFGPVLAERMVPRVEALLSSANANAGVLIGLLRDSAPSLQVVTRHPELDQATHQTLLALIERVTRAS